MDNTALGQLNIMHTAVVICAVMRSGVDVTH